MKKAICTNGFFMLLFKISVDVMNKINPFPIIYFFKWVSYSFLNTEKIIYLHQKMNDDEVIFPFFLHCKYLHTLVQ